MTDRWHPFQITPKGTRADGPRALTTPEGVADRLRAAAFAEIQARDAFRWAADHYGAQAPDGLPAGLAESWRRLADAEQKHLDWLLKRMNELGVDPGARKVSDQLWDSLVACRTAEEFALYMASAEERGRRAGERFAEGLAQTDPITSRIFGKIAEEEVAHIELALRFFPEAAARHLKNGGMTYVPPPPASQEISP